MIRARHIPVWNEFFQWYVRRKLRRHFHAVRVHAEPMELPHAVVLIGNHFSWWDGFFALEVNQRIIHKQIHVMMLEDQLRDRRFLSWAGAFSVQPGTRSALESIRYATDLLAKPGNLVVMFPQGEITSHYKHPLKFSSGWARILQAESPYHLVFMAVVPVYGSHPRPALEIFVHKVTSGAVASDAVEKDYNRFYNNAMQHIIATP